MFIFAMVFVLLGACSLLFYRQQLVVGKAQVAPRVLETSNYEALASPPAGIASWPE